MRPLRLRIQEAARQYGVPQNVIEKDYALSYTLAGLASRPELSDTLLFKGGTALKKVFFGDYRFSEDLDFSAQAAPKGVQLDSAIGEAVRQAGELLLERGPFALEVVRQPEREHFRAVGLDYRVIADQTPFWWRSSDKLPTQLDLGLPGSP